MTTETKFIIFLGAGASCSEGAPKQSDLLNKAFSKKLHTSFDKDKHLKRYFKKFWGIDIESKSLSNTTFPTFEEALGMLEIARDRHEAFKGFYSTANKKEIDHIIEDLIYLIAEILKDTLKEKNQHHINLVKNLVKKNILLKCCFISLNYDILIDNALIANHNDSYDVDYGIDFMNFEITKSRDEYWYKPNPERAINLFKIHGSLNWLYCPVCNKIKITPKKKGVTGLASVYIKSIDHEDDKFCKVCKGTFVPILIPPTYYKDMTNYFLSSVWHKAEHAIMQCNKIIFCGYSFPDADMHIKYILKRGIINRKKERDKPDIVVINNHDKKYKREKKTEESRYKRLFGKNINYTERSFEDFAENPSEFIRADQKDSPDNNA